MSITRVLTLLVCFSNDHTERNERRTIRVSVIAKFIIDVFMYHDTT